MESTKPTKASNSTKILSHFTEEWFRFDPGLGYLKMSALTDPHVMKPAGLWLSDESDYGWESWCEEQEFRIESLQHRTDFKINLNTVLVLSTDREVRNFDQKYKKVIPAPIEGGYIPSFSIIDWDRVRDEYSGILITPYSYSDLRYDLLWYNGWDCSSACIWDLSVLEVSGRAEKARVKVTSDV